MFLNVPAKASLKAANYPTTSAISSTVSGFSPVRAQQVCQQQKAQLQGKALLIGSPAGGSKAWKALAVVLPTGSALCPGLMTWWRSFMILGIDECCLWHGLSLSYWMLNGTRASTSQSTCHDQETVLGFRQVVAVDRQLDVFNRPSARKK